MRKATLFVALLLVAQPAWADSFQASWLITDPSSGLNFQYTAKVEETGGNQKITFTVANTGSISGYFRGFGLKGLFDGTLSTVGSNWFAATLFPSGGSSLALSVFNGAVNQKTSQSDLCRDGTNGYDGSICTELNLQGNDILLTAGSSLVFTFLVTGASPIINFASCTSDCGWHLQTKVFQSASGNGALGSISAGAVPSVPEPATPLLLSAGMLVAALASRRRVKARSGTR
ncbi:MAG: PEP-CTERM sorting domain-containing protein [Vicinamibacterales bacterium]